jgi:IrrE N-terminal-like domain
MTRDGGHVQLSEVVPRLRALAPYETISHADAHTVAEQQATLLLRLTRVDSPPVPLAIITRLPGLDFDWREGWPLSGTAIRARPHHWQIVIAADEPHIRKRFSVAHEFKHVLDDPVIDRWHGHLAAKHRHLKAERLCNYFAACLLMPKTWLENDLQRGRQNAWKLAERYDVSLRAMRTRLFELGLATQSIDIDPEPGFYGDGDD